MKTLIVLALLAGAVYVSRDRLALVYESSRQIPFPWIPAERAK